MIFCPKQLDNYYDQNHHNNKWIKKWQPQRNQSQEVFHFLKKVRQSDNKKWNLMYKTTTKTVNSTDPLIELKS